MLWTGTTHKISSRGFHEIVMLPALDRQGVVKTRAPPTTFTQLAGEAEPPAVHMKMAPANYPLPQKIEAVGKHQSLIPPFGALKEIRMQHQTFRFDIGEDDGGGPL